MEFHFEMGRPRRALITGIDGFTGHYLRTELESAGWQVFGMGMCYDPSDTTYRQVDLSDVAGLCEWLNLVQPHAVIHLAAISFVAHGDVEEIYRTNLFGTRNLLTALSGLADCPSAILLASSANVYGNAAEGVLSEDTPPNPANDYAVSKLAMEYMARLWQDKLPITVVRPFNYTGIGQSELFLLPKMVAHFKRRADVIELGNLDVWRDFSDVRALVQAYRRLIDVGAGGTTVNICSGRACSLREILGMAEAITGHRMEIRVNPAFVRQNEVRTSCGDPARLRSLIGQWDTPPLEETLRWMLKA